MLYIEKYLNDCRLIKNVYIITKKHYRPEYRDMFVIYVNNPKHLLPREHYTDSWRYFNITTGKLNLGELAYDREFRVVVQKIKEYKKILKVPKSILKKYFSSNYGLENIYIEI